ncbi:S41 family peptidase [Archangium violaceum]|uniref:S41 family peptidase n=1 Tax=Archangium violaceum TaxID=83451 RepID=UPI002B2CCC33|nr:S41 family peptidase [Archangium violaceum]
MKHLVFICAATCTFGMIGTGLAGCATPAAGVRPPSVEPTLLVRDGVTAELARGVWRSRGYGMLLSVSENGTQLHHETTAGCYPDPGGENSPRESLVYLEPGSTSDELSLSPTPGDTRYLFQRIQTLPAACEATVDWTPLRLFDVFAATFAEHYAFFQERGIDWNARVTALRPRITDTQDARALFGVFKELTTGLEDAHTRISAEVAGEELSYGEGERETLRRVEAAGRKTGVPAREALRAWLSAYREGILQTVLKGAGHHVANNRIVYGRVGDVGYLNIVTMGGFVEGEEVSIDQELRALNAVLDEALQTFQGARAVIVDVSNNRGGHDLISREIAARFADTRHLAYRKRPRQADVPPQTFYVEPATGPRFTGPVYLLTSDVTVSAGEIFTLAMRALPNVTHAGTATRGALSDVLVKPLPNGWRMELSNELYFDAKGELFEVRGIPPTLALDVFPEDELQTGHAKAVLTLVERVSQGAR